MHLPLFLFIVFPALAGANTFFVTTTGDDGAGSLREALVSANANPGEDLILFSESAIGVISLTNTLVVTGPVEIRGPGADVLILDGGSNGDFAIESGEVRVMSLSGSSAANPSLVSGLTFRNGASTLGGGNVRCSGSITFTQCHFLNGRTGGLTEDDFTTTSANRDGGGLHHSTGTLVLDRCLISGNGIRGNFAQGGGLYAESGTLWIQDSRIINNTTDGSVGEGGGIGNRSQMTMIDSDVSFNETRNSSSGGGGIYTDTNVTARRCTISHNVVGKVPGVAGYSVGGAFASVGGSAEFDLCVITANKAPSGLGQGAGFASLSTGVISFRGCVVAGNISTEAGGASADLDVIFSGGRARPTYRDDGYNVFGNGPGVFGGLAGIPNRPDLSQPVTGLTLASTSTRGSLEFEPLLDTDLDSIPDAVEVVVAGLDPDVVDGREDLDGDGSPNALEYMILGVPAISDASQRVTTSIRPEGEGWRLRFPQSLNREYRVLTNDDLIASPLPVGAGEFQSFAPGEGGEFLLPDLGDSAFFFIEGRVLR